MHCPAENLHPLEKKARLSDPISFLPVHPGLAATVVCTVVERFFPHKYKVNLTLPDNIGAPPSSHWAMQFVSVIQCCPLQSHLAALSLRSRSTSRCLREPSPAPSSDRAHVCAHTQTRACTHTRTRTPCKFSTDSTTLGPRGCEVDRCTTSKP